VRCAASPSLPPSVPSPRRASSRCAAPGTGQVAVARAADVDPALVYHYYGSKENLLDAATTPPQSFLDQIVTAWQAPPAELGEQLVRQMLANWRNPEHEPVLRAVMQIAGNEPAIREKLRRIIEVSMMGPSAQALSEDERALRSSLIAAQLMGLAFMRFAWKIEPLASMEDDDIVAAIAPTIQRYLDGDIHPATQESARSAAANRADHRS
jgi:AcrR family transcriptional regulator